MQLPSYLVSALALAPQSAAAQTVAYSFDGANTAGIQGVVLVQHTEPEGTRAKIFADLDFSQVDLHAIKAFDGNCTQDVVEYKWHIHVKWSSKNDAESFGKCSRALTGNHYDPLKACGPNSEFVDTNECKPRVKNYNCTPASYAKNPLACEKGDLSGKFGGFKLGEHNKLVADGWIDDHFPKFEETTAEWNMILHAVCGKATPRIACAVAKQVKYTDYDDESDDYTPYKA